jgi:quinol monooxygenase YgiN
MYLLHAELKAHPHAVAEVRRHLERTLRTARDEPGNIHFAFFSPIGSPDDFLIQELYRSKADCDLHLASPAVQDALRAFETLLQQPPRIVFGELVGGHFRQP